MTVDSLHAARGIIDILRIGCILCNGFNVMGIMYSHDLQKHIYNIFVYTEPLKM